MGGQIFSVRDSGNESLHKASAAPTPCPYHIKASPSLRSPSASPLQQVRYDDRQQTFYSICWLPLTLYIKTSISPVFVLSGINPFLSFLVKLIHVQLGSHWGSTNYPANSFLLTDLPSLGMVLGFLLHQLTSLLAHYQSLCFHPPHAVSAMFGYPPTLSYLVSVSLYLRDT